jgi:DNA polymerase-3 subunit delta'
VFFLLCESINFLLQTVLSRAVTVKLDAQSKENLKKITSCNDDFLLEYANGCPGELIKLMSDEEFISLRNSFFEIIVYLTSGVEYNLYKIYNFFDENKENKDTLFKMLITFFKDVLFYKNSCADFLTNKDKMSYITAFSEKISKRKCENVLSIITKSQTEMGKYGAYAVNVHAMLIKIWEEIYG